MLHSIIIEPCPATLDIHLMLVRKGLGICMDTMAKGITSVLHGAQWKDIQ